MAWPNKLVGCDHHSDERMLPTSKQWRDSWQPGLLTAPDKPCRKEWGENRGWSTSGTTDKDNQRWEPGWDSEVENVGKGGADRQCVQRKQSSRVDRGMYEKEREEGWKTRGGTGIFFQPLLALHFMESLQLNLYTWHLSDISPQHPSSCVRLLGPGLSTHHCLPLKSTQNSAPICTSLHTVTPTYFYPATSTALTWLSLSGMIFTFSPWRDSSNTPQQLLWETVSGEWTNIWKEEFCCCFMKHQKAQRLQ